MYYASRPAARQEAANLRGWDAREKSSHGVTLADLCTAIAKGHLPVTIDEGGCYNVKTRAVKSYFQRLERSKLGLAAEPSRN